MPKKSKKEPYFGLRQEKAVVDYINEPSEVIRNDIYEKILKKPFQIMVETILRRYPIYVGNYEMQEIEKDALSHLIQNVNKFNPDQITKKGKKTKAYSYCQTIIRNYYKDHGRKTYNEKKVNVPYENFIEEIDEKDEFHYEIYEEESNKLEKLIKQIVVKIEETIETNKEILPMEIIVGEAIINILNNWHSLFLEETPDGKYVKRITNKFAKNKILFLLKEQTRLSTKDIRISMKVFKDLYFLEKSHFFKE